MEGLLEQPGKIVRVVDQPGGLRHGFGHGDDVGLLEAELADGAAALLFVAVDLAGDEDGGGRIEVATTDGGEEVGRPGPLVARATPGTPVTRPQPSAAKAAACSWCMLTIRTSSRWWSESSRKVIIRGEFVRQPETPWSARNAAT